jgi:hypothetical protein
MHFRSAALPLLLLAAPAVAAPPPRSGEIQVPRELTDPATADRLADMMEALSQAFLDLPVGSVQAAAEGRKPTAEEKALTVRDIGRRDDPDFDSNFGRQIAQARPAIHEGMKAFAKALPEITRSLSQAADAIERAAANMPRPIDRQP